MTMRFASRGAQGAFVRSACDSGRITRVCHGLWGSLGWTSAEDTEGLFVQVNAVQTWWSGAGSNRRPSAFQADARTN